MGDWSKKNSRWINIWIYRLVFYTVNLKYVLTEIFFQAVEKTVIVVADSTQNFSVVLERRYLVVLKIKMKQKDN